ncbi:PilZ domain-containing protein [Paraglaciecola sp.]|uniref:PilZ domain-containing protein n=1 Tax=Paraglaciecola sp. TaxID=1920173 RepID=UPI0030F41CC3
MMEKRQFPRFKTQGLHAVITFYHPNSSERVSVQGEVLDMSLAGIKIKLASAVPAGISDSKIKIALTSAHSKVPMQINGVIRHRHTAWECGVQFAQGTLIQEVDDLLFECTRVKN